MTLHDDDIDRIMAVMETAFDPQFGEAWKRRQVLDALVLGACHYAILDADEAKGFYLSRHGVDEEELLLIAVAPAYRRIGLGRNLLDDFVKAAKSRGARRVLLEMRRENPALNLYRSRGFCQVGERRGYYRTPDGSLLDAVTLALDLN
ncbi:MAG: GNAT family N-acetyltransferase [Novosphingobium sp.]